jgi:hypothetical protein
MQVQLFHLWCAHWYLQVRSSRSVTLWLRETHEAGATLQRLARMPAGRGYQRVHHIAFAGATWHGQDSSLTSTGRLAVAEALCYWGHQEQGWMCGVVTHN